MKTTQCDKCGQPIDGRDAVVMPFDSAAGDPAQYCPLCEGRYEEQRLRSLEEQGAFGALRDGQ